MNHQDSLATWAQDAADRLMAEFDGGAIDTANYQLCGFIYAAAKLAQQDADLAARIGALMEPPRSPHR